MNDLIARAKKYAIGAGRIGQGQYDAAEKENRLSRWLSWTSIALSAVVGTSIFAEWAEGTYRVPLGLAAIIAAASSALQRTSKLDERADAHRVAGAKYGRIRRRADMLRVRLIGGDISREAGLLELDGIGEDLSKLAAEARSLPYDVYRAAVEAFDQTHPEYLEDRPSHAGGVVVRTMDSITQCLLIEAKSGDKEWVLPKGHIKPGESAEQAARREVLEEAGIVAAVGDALDTVEFLGPKGRVRATFFLMEAVEQGPPREGRERVWLTFSEAAGTLRFKESQWLIWRAEALLQETQRRHHPR